MNRALAPPADLVGQVVMVGFRGVVVNDEIKEMITKYRVGSIVLNQQNIVDVQQVSKLTRDLQIIAKDAGHVQPLLIATDQEGGMLATIRDAKGITQFPGAMALSSAIDPETLIYDVAKATALELLAIGINWILGPVLDILSNPTNHLLGVRTFGRVSQDVSRYASACARGFHAAGIATCGKHFPGYGNAFVFSSAGVPVINETKEQLEDDLAPYRVCSAEGSLDGVLIGGAVIPKVTGQLSACLSPKVMKDMLRADLNFQGLAVSDCLQMESIHNEIGIPQAAIMAIWAGCDLLLNCHNRVWQIQVLVALNEAIEAHVLPLNLVSQAADRVAKLKARKIDWPTALAHRTRTIDFALHRSLSKRAYDQCVQVVRDHGRILPLSRQGSVLLLTPLVRDYHAKDRYDEAELPDDPLLVGELSFQNFGKELNKYAKVIHTSYTANGVSPEQEALLTRAAAVIVITADGLRNLYQISFTKHLSIVCKSLHKPFCVMAISNPFDFWHEERTAPTYLISHEMTEQALSRAVYVLMHDPPQQVLGQVTTGLDQSPAEQSSASTKRKLPSRSRWLTASWQDKDHLSQSLLSDCTAIPDFSPERIRQMTTDHRFSVVCVRNPNTSEVYGLALALEDTLLELVVLQSHRNMSIGYSLLLRTIELAREQQRERLYLNNNRINRAFLSALSIFPTDYDGKTFIALNDYEFQC